MTQDISAIYDELVHGITGERLKIISTDVISAYRTKEHLVLAWYARRLGVSPDESLNRLFARIIQRYHPDRHAGIHLELAGLRDSGDMASLLRMREAYLFTSAERAAAKKAAQGRSFDLDETEVYREDDFRGDEYDEEYDDGEFDDRETPSDDEWEGGPEDEEEWDEEETAREEWGFIEAVNEFLFGNQDFCVEPVDLRNYRGVIDLSGTDIGDIQGIEYCVLVTIINISGNDIDSLAAVAGLTQLEALYCAENQIDSIRPLAGLVNLRELDISYNNIDDISVLLELPALVYVNCMGNPIEGRSILDKLAGRGVVVIFD